MHNTRHNDVVQTIHLKLQQRDDEWQTEQIKTKKDSAISKNIVTLSNSSVLSVTIDRFDNIFVTDSSNHKIQKFDSKGKFLTMGVPRVKIMSNLQDS